MRISDWSSDVCSSDLSTVSPLVPPSLEAFLLVAALFGALFAAAGFAALARARRPEIWAGVSAALPVILLAVAYWRVTDLGVDLVWSAAAVDRKSPRLNSRH